MFGCDYNHCLIWGGRGGEKNHYKTIYGGRSEFKKTMNDLDTDDFINKKKLYFDFSFPNISTFTDNMTQHESPRTCKHMREGRGLWVCVCARTQYTYI